MVISEADTPVLMVNGSDRILSVVLGDIIHEDIRLVSGLRINHSVVPV